MAKCSPPPTGDPNPCLHPLLTVVITPIVPQEPTSGSCAGSPTHDLKNNCSTPLEGCTPHAQVQGRLKDYSEDVGYLTIKPLQT
jgi:hypothetical protein